MRPAATAKALSSQTGLDLDLGEKNEINTADAIKSLKKAGTYSAAAHNDARAKAEELAGLFEGKRHQREGRETKHSLKREGPHDHYRL